jgi:hypothetical protein
MTFPSNTCVSKRTKLECAGNISTCREKKYIYFLSPPSTFLVDLESWAGVSNLHHFPSQPIPNVPEEIGGSDDSLSFFRHMGEIGCG